VRTSRTNCRFGFTVRQPTHVLCGIRFAGFTGLGR